MTGKLRQVGRDERRHKRGGHDAPDRLGVGEQGTVMVAIDCYASPGDSTETWTVEVSATGGGTSADTTRSVTVTCSGGE